MSRFEYAGESTFWYFLARRAEADGRLRVLRVIEQLNDRATQLRLPVVYHAPHATAWALVCQLFNVTHPRADSLGRLGFSVMQIGFARVLGPKGFVEMAIKRILGNITEPAFPGRSRDESVVDSFLANGLKLKDERTVDPSADYAILSQILTDGPMRSLGTQACAPPPGLWDSTVREYARRRPGWFRRHFSDPNRWLSSSWTVDEKSTPAEVRDRMSLSGFRKEDATREDKIAVFATDLLRQDSQAAELLNRSNLALFAQGYRPSIGVPHDPEANGLKLTDLRRYFIRKLYLDVSALAPIERTTFEAFIDSIGRDADRTVICAGEIAVKYDMNLEGRFNFGPSGF